MQIELRKNWWKPCAVSYRLRLARARHALEYYSFFHSAAYTLKHPKPTQDQPSKFQIPEATPPLHSVTEVMPTVIVPLPPPPRDPPPTLLLPPPPEMPPPSLTPAPPVLGLAFPLPLIEATPPNPHLSCGACSDTDVYSPIGATRLSRLSSLSNQSKVILFEHSSLWPLLPGATQQMKWKSCIDYWLHVSTSFIYSLHDDLPAAPTSSRKIVCLRKTTTKKKKKKKLVQENPGLC